MNTLDLARVLDGEDRLVEAAWAYELALAKGEGDLGSYLDLAVLYFHATDFGTLSYHHLSDGFVQVAWGRAHELLDDCERRLGPNTEVSFWRRFFSYVRFGEPEFVEDCERLVAAGNSLVPYLHLYAVSGGNAHREEAAKLYQHVREGRTVRQRLVKSILDSPALRHPLAAEPRE